MKTTLKPIEEKPTPIAAEEIAQRRRAAAAERFATEIHEQKTEGRTPRPFRTNPHE